VAQRVCRGIVLLFHDHGTRRGEWSAARPGRTLPPGKTRYPFYRRLGGPQGRSGRAENLVFTGIRSRTFQPVAQSLYRLSYPGHNVRLNYVYIRRHLAVRVKLKRIFLGALVCLRGLIGVLCFVKPGVIRRV